jgi:indole-3-glycerol phosphate synthase
VREAWIAGADAVLLIVAVLADHELQRLHAAARELGLDALVEVHDEVELERALRIGAEIVGVNNRDLRTMEVRLETALRLAPLVPQNVVAVAESGIRSGADIKRLREAGYDAFLIGESLMLSEDPRQALEDLLKEARS